MIHTGRIAAFASSAGICAIGALVGISAVPAVLGSPTCDKKVVPDPIVSGSTTGCEEWTQCDADDICATVTNGDYQSCGTPTTANAYCRTAHGGTYNPVTGLCEEDENTTWDPADPAGGTWDQYLAPVDCVGSGGGPQ